MNNDYGIQKISPSMITAYENCPRGFYYTSFLGLKLPQSMMHLEFGTAIHSAIEKIYAERVGSEWPATADITPAIQEFSSKFTLNSLSPDDFKSEGDRQTKYMEMYEDGILMIRAYWEGKEIIRDEYGIDPYEFEVPRKTQIHLPETDGPWPVPISMRRDATAKNHIVIEFKTSASEYDVFETRASAQALSYCLQYYLENNVIPKVVYIVMIKKRKKNKVQILPIQYDLADLLSFDGRVKVVLKKIRNHEFSRALQNHSYFCDCRKFDALLDISKYETNIKTNESNS